MIDPQVAFDKLAQFETAHELARFFEHHEIKAIPGASSSCAISVFMSQQTNSPAKTSYREGKVLSSHGTFYWENTHAMRRFIENFDNEDYKELIDKEFYVDRDITEEEGYYD